MKKILLILFLLSTCNIFSQTNNESVLTCETIKKGIIDRTLYDSLNNGKLIFRPNLNKIKVFKINTSESEFYYVSMSQMKRIKRYIRKNGCKGIKIESIDKQQRKLTN